MFEVGSYYEGSSVFNEIENLGTFKVVIIDEAKKLIVLEFEGEYIAVKATPKYKFLEPNIKGNEWIIYQ